MHTYGEEGPVERKIEHNHRPVIEKEQCYLALDKLKADAKVSEDKPRTLIKKSQVILSDEAASIMPRANSITQRIHYVRRCNSVVSIPATDRKQIVIADELKFTTTQ